MHHIIEVNDNLTSYIHVFANDIKSDTLTFTSLDAVPMLSFGRV